MPRSSFTHSSVTLPLSHSILRTPLPSCSSLNSDHHSLLNTWVLHCPHVAPALRIKVADFGTCAFTDITSRHKGGAPLRENVLSMSAGKSGDLDFRFHTNGVGTMLWMAPEVIQGELYGREADVYSYGIVLWEIAAQWCVSKCVNYMYFTRLTEYYLCIEFPV